MRTVKSISMLLIISLALLAVPGTGIAENAASKATLTFNKAIEIPGVVLKPGTYVFKTVSNDKRMVQVWDKKESHLYATLLTRVNYLNNPAAETVATFDGHSTTAPPALKTLQIKNQNIGAEFLYGPNSTPIMSGVSASTMTEAQRKAAIHWDEGCFLWTCQ